LERRPVAGDSGPEAPLRASPRVPKEGIAKMRDGSETVESLLLDLHLNRLEPDKVLEVEEAIATSSQLAAAPNPAVLTKAGFGFDGATAKKLGMAPLFCGSMPLIRMVGISL
jgi:hypothetical protein